MLALQFSRPVPDSFRCSNQRFHSCHDFMNIVKSGLTHGGAVSTLDNYDNRSGRFGLKTSFLEGL